MPHRPLPEFLLNDSELFAIAKPPGLHSVMQSQSDNLSVAALLLEAHPALEAAAPKVGDAGLVNRLDYDTSGILLGAWNRGTWERLSTLLKSGGITKSYHVILEGRLASTQRISGWIGSPYRRGSKVRVYSSVPPKSVRALPAASEVNPVCYDQKSDCTLVLVDCAVARRHQVRAHCAALGHPLLGDVLYGSARQLKEPAPADESRGFFLHAGSASFFHPITQERVRLEAPLPDWIVSRFKL
jgi:23S rRNA pseudouridine1911/1915/1917 synthase